MKFIQFVFSGFWVWLGFILLVLVAGAVVIVAIREAKKKTPEELDREKAYAELLRAKARNEQSNFCFGEIISKTEE